MSRPPLDPRVVRKDFPILADGKTLALPTSGVLQATDRLNRSVLVFEADWVLRYTMEKNPGVEFRDTM